MSTSEKAELSMSICHIEKVSKSGIPIYSSTAFDMADRETATTGIYYVFHTNTINLKGHT